MPPKYRQVAKGVSGKVCWFNRRQGEGRIFFDHFGEVFVKGSDVKDVNQHGDNFLLQSQQVICNILSGPRGLQAVKVKVRFLQPSRTFSASSRSGYRSSRPSSECSGNLEFQQFSAPNQSEVIVIEKDLRGEVLEFDCQYGRGFILVHQYGKIACFSQFVKTCASDETLKPTQIVKCDIGRARNGLLLAINVIVICEAIAPAVDKTGDIIATDVVGKVLSYYKKRNYGFIRLEDAVIFFNSKALQNVTSLTPNQIVKFDLAHGSKSRIALNIRLNEESEAASHSNPLQNHDSKPSSNNMDAAFLSARSQLPDLLSANSEVELLTEKTENLTVSRQKDKVISENISKQKLICNICEDDLEDGVSVPCGHFFCRECLNEWRAVNPSCPIDGKAISRKSIKSISLLE